MPIAEPFGGGIGNGFPACVPTDPDMSVGYTLKQVMNMFWNIGTINVANMSFSHTNTGEFSPPSFSISLDKMDCQEPGERVCAKYERFETGIGLIERPYFRQAEYDSFSYVGNPDIGFFDYADASVSIDVYIRPHKGEDGGGLEGQYSTLKKGFSNFNIELRLSANSNDFLEDKLMRYYPYELDTGTVDHIATAGEITLYGYFSSFFGLPFNIATDPHITSIDFYTYP